MTAPDQPAETIKKPLRAGGVHIRLLRRLSGRNGGQFRPTPMELSSTRHHQLLLSQFKFALTCVTPDLGSGSENDIGIGLNGGQSPTKVSSGLIPMSQRLRMLSCAQHLSTPILIAANLPGGLVENASFEGIVKDRRVFSPLEIMGRLLCGIAPLLERQITYTNECERIDLVAVHEMLNTATDPDHPNAVNFDFGSQPLVDAAFLAQAMLRAPTALYERLPPRVQQNVANALMKTRVIQPHHNNWLLFSAMIEAVLCRFGFPWDGMRIDYALRQHEQWYVGDGVYSDGPYFHWDYYNSFVIHPMLIDILNVVGDKHKDWSRFREKGMQRALRIAELLERMIAADGSFPPIGRSITYRCGAFHLLAQLVLQRALPESLPPAQVRCALLAVIERTLGSSENYDQNGWLRIGLNGAQPKLGERYITTGSLYLCSTAFLPLGLGETDPFWSDPDAPWTQYRLWSLGESLSADRALD